MGRSSLSRRVQAIEAQRNKAFAQQINGVFNRIETHPIDLALQICILRVLEAAFSADEMPQAIRKLQETFDSHLKAMDDVDRAHVQQIVTEYQAASVSGHTAIRTVTDNHTANIKSD